MNAALYVVPSVERARPPAPVEVEVLFQLHGPFLVRTLERITGDTACAEDLVQEAFLVAHRRRTELRPDGNPRAWLYRVAMNLLLRSRRSFARERRFLGQVTNESATDGRVGVPDQVAIGRERAQRVQRAVAQLPLVHREVFVLFELEGLSGPEIGAMLELPVATVWTRLHRARKHFRTAWDKVEAST